MQLRGSDRPGDLPPCPHHMMKTACLDLALVGMVEQDVVKSWVGRSNTTQSFPKISPHQMVFSGQRGVDL